MQRAPKSCGSRMGLPATGGRGQAPAAAGNPQARRRSQHHPSPSQPRHAAAWRSRPQQVQQHSRRRVAAAAAGEPGRGPHGQQQRRQLLPPPGAAALELAPGSVDIESLTYEDGCFAVQGCLLTAASPDVVYEVLTDYESLPRVFHNVETSSLQRCPDTGRKRLVQTCRWAFLVFSGTFVNELDVVEDPASRQLTFSLVQSAFMREFVGSWDVRRVSEGLTEVRHRLAVRPVVAPPQKIGDLSNRIFRSQVVGILEDLAGELEERRALS